LSLADRNSWRPALLDGFAVLVGILLAFGIDAWWDLNAERARGQAYLTAVRDELVSNRAVLEADLDTLDSWVRLSERHLRTIISPGAPAPSRDSVLEMVWRTGPQRPTPIARTAIDDLLSSGGFQFIESAALRRAIAEYDRALERDAEEQQVIRDYFFNAVQPYHIEHGSFVDFDLGLGVGIDVSDIDFPIDREAFVGNRTYANMVVVRILEFRNLRDTHLSVLARIEEVLELIESAF
jgi:hypothetical protein